MAIAHQKEIVEYCRHRLQELEQYRKTLAFFQSEHMVTRYGVGLELILKELTESRNSEEVKVHNISHYLQTNLDTNHLFGFDIHSILNTGKSQLPELLKIPEYWAEKARKEEEAKEELRKREFEAYLARSAAREEEAKKREQLELASKLGLTPQALARLQQQ